MRIRLPVFNADRLDAEPRKQVERSPTTIPVSRTAVLRSAAFLMCLLLHVQAEDKIHIVRKNDTVSSIALEHGISTSHLARFNALSNPDRIYVGQRLRIPSSSDTGKIIELPPALRRTLDAVAITSNRWERIVIHHSATPMGNVRDMDRYHRKVRHMKNGLAYHFVIGNGRGMEDGEIAVGHRWLKQLNGGHVASESLNATSIGICLVGNFDQTRPSRRQLDSLEGLTRYLLHRCELDASCVKTHRQIGRTRCPGRHFPTEGFLERLRGGSRGGARDVKANRTP